MRIAILEPYIGGVGGAQKVIAKLASYLKSKKHHVEFFTQRYEDTPYEDFKKVKINILKPSSKFLSPFIFLFKKIKNFDIVIVGGFPTNFSTIRNRPSFFICYSPKRDFYDLKKYLFEKASLKGKIILFLKNLFFKKLDFIAAQKATFIAPISKTVQKRVEEYYKRRDSEIVYCGIDFKNYKQGKYKDYIFCISRFVSAKRVDVVIKSMGYVKNKKVRLYVAGDGPEKENIKNLCKKYENVKFLGKIDEKRLIDLYSNCLAVAYVPINDDWALVPFEAGASGKMTIGPNEGALKEVISKDKTGFLLDEITPENIAEKIDFLMNNKKRAINLGKEARKKARKFDWNVLMPKWEKLILGCVKKHD